MMADLAKLRRAQYGIRYYDPKSNAKMFLRAYMERMPGSGYRGSNAQAYANWRTAWLTTCLAQLPTWEYKRDPIAAEAHRSVERHAPQLPRP